MSDTVIRLQKVSFSFNSIPALKDVNLEVKERDFLAILGPNGGGKTTLIKIMLGILKPDHGNVLVYGKPPLQTAHKMGYVPQEAHINQGFPISVMDVTLMGRLPYTGRTWRYSRKDKKKAEEALERMGMLKYKKTLVHQLSGGQKQRVFIARALASQPDILVMDEPTSSVDQEWQTRIYEFLNELNNTKTVIVVSHDISVLSSYVKSVACVNRGLFYHDKAEITQEMMDQVYHCPVELVAHGVPHRVLRDHEGE